MLQGSGITCRAYRGGVAALEEDVDMFTSFKLMNSFWIEVGFFFQFGLWASEPVDMPKWFVQAWT